MYVYRLLYDKYTILYHRFRVNYFLIYKPNIMTDNCVGLIRFMHQQKNEKNNIVLL